MRRPGRCCKFQSALHGKRSPSLSSFSLCGRAVSCGDKLTAGFGLTLRLHDRLYCLRKIAKQTLRSVNFALPFTGFSGIVPAF